ncbi:hypothetical protein HPP92_002650 [Vanilla planifolia]|nr:hypothetical protein HPP92_002650 [Vanilla planifolia]
MEDGGELITFALGNECNEEKVEDVLVDDDEIGLAAAFIQLEVGEDHISPEDLAWVDSCLVADPESAVERWADLKEALLDTISAFAASRVENNGYGLDDAEAEQMQVDMEKSEDQPKFVNNGENTAGVG